MQLELDEQARYDLAQWGLCMRPQYLPGYESVPINTVRLDVLGNALTISEEYACDLDRVISGLKLYDAQSHNAAKLYFVSGANYRTIAEIMHINRNRVGSLIDSAVSWVARGLHDRNLKKVA